MSTPTQMKLTKPGESLTMAIMSAALVPVGTYPEVEFVGFNGKKEFVSIRVPKQSADRQLQRCELPEYGDTVGKLLTFGRDPNAKQPTKPYWAITLEGNAPDEYLPLLKAGAPAASPAATAPAPASAPAAATAASHAAQNGVAEREKYSTAYKRITEFVLTDIVPLYEAKKIPVTAEACHAMAATLFIGVTRNNY